MRRGFLWKIKLLFLAFLNAFFTLPEILIFFNIEQCVEIVCNKWACFCMLHTTLKTASNFIVLLCLKILRCLKLTGLRRV